jgi:uncharacterized protein
LRHGTDRRRAALRINHLKLPSTLLIALTLAAALLAAQPIRAQDYPDPVGYVNDFANVIDSDIEAGLEDALRLAEEETTVEIAVVTVPDLGGLDINTYAVELFEEWGIGQRGEDNGVLFITAIAERETRIEVGYGLEPYITDGRAGRILDDSVRPAFREDNFSLGILDGVTAIRIALDETGYTEGARPPQESGIDLGIFQPLADRLWLVIVLGLLSLYVVTYMARTRSVWLGGVWGAGVGGLVGWIIAGWAGLAVGIAGIGFGGLVLDAILSTAYRYQSSSGRSTSWGRTWGGFGGAGGGFRSGGFGGFGGGRSGGGGARRGF